MDDLEVRVKAILDPDVSESASNINAKAGEIGGRVKPIKLPVTASGDDIQKALKKIYPQNAISLPVDIDTSGMDERIGSAVKQIDNYIEKIKESKGVINSLKLSEVDKDVEDGTSEKIEELKRLIQQAKDRRTEINANGKKYNRSEYQQLGKDIADYTKQLHELESSEGGTEKAYKAVIQYTTAIGETFTRTVEIMADTGEIVTDTVDGMAVNFDKQRQAANGLVNDIDSYGAKLRQFKADYSEILNLEGNEDFRKSVEAIDFSQITDVDSLNEMVARFRQAQGEAKALSAELKNVRLDAKLRQDAQLYAQDLEKLKVQASTLLGGEGNDRFKKLIESIDFSKIANADELSEMVNKLKEAQKMLSTINAEFKGKDLASNAIEQIDKRFEKIRQSLRMMKLEIGDMELPSDMMHQLTEMENILKRQYSQSNPLGGEAKVSAFNDLQKLYDSFKNNLAYIQAENAALDEQIAKEQKLAELGEQRKQTQEGQSHDYWQGQFEETIAQMTRVNDELLRMRQYYQQMESEANKSASAQAKEAAQQQRAMDKLNSLAARYKATGTRYSAFQTDPALRTEYEKLGNVIASLQARLKEMRDTGVWDNSITGDIASANAQLGQFSNNVVAAGLNAKSFGDQFKNAIAKFGTWLSATSILMKTVQKLKDAVNQVKEIDSAMVNLKKVTDETDATYQKFLQQTGATAKQIGSTVSDLIEATATFAKLGYSFGESQELAKVATIFANVGDFTSIDTATNSLITAMKSFGLTADDAMGIADKINEVANRYAVSADDLAEGMTNSASALSLAGNTIDETIAMITAMSEITQDASESGNALKILSMRLRGAKADLASAGEETDGMCDSVSSLREKILALTGSVDIMADEAGTQFKSTYQIMSEIAQVWDNLTNINQAALLETIAGKMRGNSISALLTSMAQADNVLTDSLNSAGSALTEHERWLDSIEAKEEQMKAAWQDFSDSLIDTGAVSGWYDALSSILGVLTKIVDTFGTIPMLIGGITSALSAKNLFGKVSNSNGEVVGTIGGSSWKQIVGAYNATGANGKKAGFSGALSQIFNGNVNTELVGHLQEIADSADGTVLTMENLRDAITGVNGETIRLNNATKQAIAGINGGDAAMQSLGISTDLVTKKTIAQTAAITARNAALTLGIGLLVTAAITAISKIPDLIHSLSFEGQLEALKAGIEKSKGEYEDVKSEIQSVNDELAKTQERIGELSRLDNLTFVQKGELEELKNTNEELERRNKLLLEQKDMKLEETREQLREQYETEFNQDDIRKNIDVYKALSRQEDVNDIWGFEEGSKASQFAQGVINAFAEATDKADDLREKLVGVYESISVILDSYDGDDEFTQGVRDFLSEIYESLYPEEFKTQNFNEIIGLPQFEKAQKELINKAKDGSLKVEDIYGYEGLTEALDEVGISAEEATEQFKALYEAEVEAREASSSLYGVREQFAGTSAADSTLQELIGDQGYYASITEEQYGKLVEAGNEYAACVENENGFMQLNIKKAKELIDTKYREERATIDAGKAHAKEKYKENTQEIAVQEKALELLAVQYDKNTDEYKNFSAQILATIASLKSENEQISNDIAGYERLASEIEFATSAYKNWLDAQDAPNAGDAYDNLRSAMEQIQSGLNSGKIGTAQYKASVELLVPEGEDVQKYIDTLQRYLTEDSTGLQNFINDMFNRNNPFLSKNSDGTFAFMEGVTVEDIAKGLGLTPEVTQYMLTALKDYGWDVDMFNTMFDEADGYKKYEAAQASLAEAQDRLNKLTENGITSGSEYNKALQDVASAEDDVAKAGADIGVVGGEESDIDKLKSQLEEIKSAYDTLAEMKIGGEVDANFLSDAEKIQSIIDTLNKQSTYTVGINTPEDLAAKQQELADIQSAIANLDSLFNSGKISEELYVQLSGNLKDDLATVNSEIDTYNQSTLNGKTAMIDVQDNSGEAEERIQAVADKEYTAFVKTVVEPPTEEEFEKTVEETQNKWNDYVKNGKDANGNYEPAPYGSKTADALERTERDYYGYEKETKTAQKSVLDTYSNDLDKWNAVVKATAQAKGNLDDAAKNLGTSVAEIEKVYSNSHITPPAADMLEEVKTALKDETGFEVQVNADTGGAMEAVNAAKQAINDTVATIKVKGQYIGTTGIAMMAKGTKDAKDEDAIVGEAGVETWIHGDSFRTVGENGAELVHLSRGDQILNADETKKLFGGKSKSGRAFALGTNYRANYADGGGKNIITEIAEAVKKVAGGGAANIGGVKPANQNKGGGGNTEKTIKEILDGMKDLVDWIPEALENAKEKTDAFIREADKAVSYMGKNSSLNKALASIDNEIDLNNQAFERYMKQADDTASMLRLSEDVVQKIREGTIDIESYDEETRSAISEYQKWFDKAEDAKNNIISLNDQVKTLSKQKLDNIISQFEDVGSILNSHVDLYKQLIEEKKQYGEEISADEYSKIVDDLGVTVDTLTEERQQLQDELDSLMASGTVLVGDEIWNEYSDKLITLSTSISEARTSLGEMSDTIGNIPLDRLNIVADTIGQLQNTLDGISNLRNAQGKEITDDLYQSMISATQAQIDNLEKQNQLLVQQLNGLDPLSEKYQEINNQINENNADILSAKASQEEWNDSIIDSQIESLKKQNDEMKNQIALMDAIEGLEKAKQRRALIYREGRGFNYEAIESDVREAQKALDDVTFDRQIKALENSKADSNLYDDYGNELVPVSNVVNGFDFSALQNGAITGMNEATKNALASFNAQAVAGNTKAQENNITIASGAITLNGVNDVSAMADAIVNQLPSYITQELGK